MEIRQVPITEIKTYSRNAKKHPEDQIQKIANSIKEFGFKQPLVLDKKNVIIVGHGRYEAAKKLNMEKLPCLYADDLTPGQIKAYRLADNKLNESEWNIDLVMDELKELDKALAALTGFDLDLLSGDDIDFDNIESTEDRKKEFKDELVTCPHCNKSFTIKI